MSFKIDYKKLIKDSHQKLIKKILKDVSKNGLPGEHHFYISFATKFPGVEIAEWMKNEYQNGMTIVIQNWFENLIVSDQFFSIILSFNNKPEKIIIPFDSIINFTDPSVNFSLQFEISLSKSLKEETKRQLNQGSFNEEIKQLKLKKNDKVIKKDNIIKFDKYKD